MKRNGKLNALRILFLVLLAALLLTLAVKAIWTPPQQVTVKLETAEEPVDSAVFDVEAKEPSQVREDSAADGLTYLGEFHICRRIAQWRPDWSFESWAGSLWRCRKKNVF